MPGLVQRVLGVSFLMSAVVASFWASHDMGGGVAFAVSSLWAMANLVVWTGLVLSFLRPEPRNPLAIMAWLGAKLLLLAGGFAGLLAAAPLTKSMAWGVVLGVSAVLLVIVLTALGSAVTGVDFLRGGQARDAGGSGHEG